MKQAGKNMENQEASKTSSKQKQQLHGGVKTYDVRTAHKQLPLYPDKRRKTVADSPLQGNSSQFLGKYVVDRPSRFITGRLLPRDKERN